MKTGKEKLIEQFLADGISYMFGNPGTVEQGFLDILEKYPQMQYITCLHESVAVAAADGYARKTKKPALVQLHSGVGLGNGIGMLYQAYRGHTPLIVIAGEAGIKYSSMDAQMACDLVEMAGTVTKYAERVIHKDSLLRLVRRAVKIAMTPPMGPVFLCLPMDILEEENREEVFPSVQINTWSTPDLDETAEIASWLSKAENPILLAGDGVNEANAEKELEYSARLLGAKVYGVNTSCVNISQNSPYYFGDLGHMFGANSEKIVKTADAVLMVGTYAFPEVFPCLENPFAANAKVFHVDLNSHEIAKNHPVDIGLAVHPKAFLECLNKDLKDREIQNYEKRMEQIKARKAEPLRDGSVVAAFMECLKKFDKDKLTIFDEALTASAYVTSFLPRERDGSYFQTRGGSLGVGIPGAIGISLAALEETVLAFTGDGGSMYTIQALYTAARYNLPIKVVICNNGGYHLLKDNIEKYWEEQEIPKHCYPDCFTFRPGIDYVGLAKSMGVEAVRADTHKLAAEAARLMMESKGPFLVELKTDH